jgi:hypothetical protein
MRNRLAAISLAGIGFLAIGAVAASAHHGSSAMDTSKKVTLTGTVTEWVWANPHCWLKMDVKDDKGNVAHWVIEENAPATLVGYGFTRSSFKPGDMATVTMNVSKSGTPNGRAGKVVVNGKTYEVLNDEGGGNQ